MGGGCIALAFHPAALGSIPSNPEIFSYVAEVNQLRWLEESGQRLENVQTRLVLPSKYYKKNVTLMC